MIGVGLICKRHTGEDTEETHLCPFPDAIGGACHQCNKPIPNYADAFVAGLSETAISYCSKACQDLWDAAHPGYWIPIEETLPGGKYDGIWENSGFGLDFRKDESV